MVKFSTLFTAKEVDFKVFQTENIYQNEYQIDNNENTGSDIEATKPVLQHNHLPV